MFSTKQSAIQPYASAADFCRIFEQNMNRLYLLSYLLTADHGMAEQCFERSLEHTTRNPRVFRDWAESWARRTIMHTAIELMHPSRSSSKASGSPRPSNGNEAAPISAVVALPPFERFAFVMSVLERQSPRDCSLLLGCGREDVVAARGRALQQLGQNTDHSQEPKRVRSNERSARKHRDLPVSELVVSA